MSCVYNVSKPDPRRAPDLAPRPTFGVWDAGFFLDQPGMSLSEADEVIFGHWDDYADQAINLLHRMIKQTEELVFSDDEYTDLVRTFQAFPHRPNLSTVLRDNVYDENECAVKVLISPVQKVWHMWATRVEKVHRDLAQKMSRCKLKLAKRDEDDFGLVLDSASDPDEEPENPKTGLEAHMELMGFQQ